MTPPTYLITGASSDLGRTLIRSLGPGGGTILAHCCQGRERLAEIMPEVSGAIRLFPADFAQLDDTVAFIRQVRETGAVPDGIVHLAAPRVVLRRFAECSWQEFELHQAIQVRSITMILREFLPLMARRRSGQVVFVLTSYLRGVPPKCLAPYLTAKYALLGLMKTAAAEYADRQVSINAVSPAMMETRYLAEVPEKVIELEASRSPRKRNARPDDVVPAIRFLLSSEANYITGENLVVSGG